MQFLKQFYKKKIGQGWQYTVYDNSNERVLKKFNSKLLASWIIFKKNFPFNEYPFWKTPAFVESAKHKALHSFEILKNKNIPQELIGNPVFLNRLDYEQDKVTPLHEIFKTHSIEDSKKAVDMFITFNQKLLQHGIIDKYFNISKNFGLNKEGKMILMDIGEIIDYEKEILKLQKMRIWEESFIIKEIKNEDIQKYFLEQMNCYFNVK